MSPAMSLEPTANEVKCLPRIRKYNQNVNIAAKRQIRKASKDNHEWTDFEMTVLITLVCHGVHKPTSAFNKDLSYMDVSTALNKILNGKNQKKDIPIEDVTAMLKNLIKCKAAIAYMERKGPIKRVSRAMLQVWKRGLTFDGSQKEWNDWREKYEMRIAEERATGKCTSVEADISGVGVGWGEDSATTDGDAVEDAAAWGVGSAPDEPTVSWGGTSVTNEPAPNVSCPMWGGISFAPASIEGVEGHASSANNLEGSTSTGSALAASCSLWGGGFSDELTATTTENDLEQPDSTPVHLGGMCPMSILFPVTSSTNDNTSPNFGGVQSTTDSTVSTITSGFAKP